MVFRNTDVSPFGFLAGVPMVLKKNGFMGLFDRIGTLLRQQDLHSSWPAVGEPSADDAESRFESLVEANDEMLERVVSFICLWKCGNGASMSQSIVHVQQHASPCLADVTFSGVYVPAILYSWTVKFWLVRAEVSLCPLSSFFFFFLKDCANLSPDLIDHTPVQLFVGKPPTVSDMRCPSLVACCGKYKDPYLTIHNLIDHFSVACRRFLLCNLSPLSSLLQGTLLDEVTGQRHAQPKTGSQTPGSAQSSPVVASWNKQRVSFCSVFLVFSFSRFCSSCCCCFNW